MSVNEPKRDSCSYLNCLYDDVKINVCRPSVPRLAGARPGHELKTQKLMCF